MTWARVAGARPVSSALRPCLDCGEPAQGSRCPTHARMARAPLDRATHNRAYDTPAWRRTRRAILARWVRAHGYWCPGWARDAHPARDLTVDHTVALASGGGMFDPDNLGVLCRSCNGRKGARE